MTQNTGKQPPGSDEAGQQLDSANRELMMAYLWMKQIKNGLEKRQFVESIVFFLTDTGEISGWTEKAALTVNKRAGSLRGKKISDFFTITEKQSFPAVLASVKPLTPAVVTLVPIEPVESASLFTAKISSVVQAKTAEKRRFFMVLYPHEKKSCEATKSDP